MVLEGECVKDRRTVCMDCGTPLNIQVLCSAAGYYIGFYCPHCGPYSRESCYFGSYEEAAMALVRGIFLR